MKVLASVGYLLQLSQALKKNDDYDYLDFWALIEKLEKRTTDSLRMAAYKTANQEETVILDVPTRLKKTGEGITVDIEKTSSDGSSLGRKKDKSGSYIYDDYYAYFSNGESNAYTSDYDYTFSDNQKSVDDDYYDDYYFIPNDVTTSTQQTTTAQIQTTRRPTRRPKTTEAFSNHGLIAAPRPPNYAWGHGPDTVESQSVEYEYYFEYYIDDLGNKRKKKKKRRKKKKQTKNEVVGYANDFQCWQCLSANSYEDCMNIGRYVTCNAGSIGCHIEVRSRRINRYKPREIEKIHMGCKQIEACIVEHKYNSVNEANWHPQCFAEDSSWPTLLQWDHSTCRQCCPDSNCNYQWLLESHRLDTSAEWDTVNYFTKVPST